MYPKPDSCHGCPLYGDGKGFVPDTLNEQAEVMVMAQNPGEDEELGRRVTGYQYGQATYEETTPRPLIGKTGYAWETQYLPSSGRDRQEVSCGNVLKCRYKHHNDLPPLASPIVKQALQHCKTAHFKLPPKTKLIVAMGEYALFSLTGESNVSAWRGYMLPGPAAPSNLYRDVPVLAVNHTAAIFRAPSLAMLARADWAKVSRILGGTWPKPFPKMYTQPNKIWPAEFAFDTEYIPKTGQLIRYSIASRDITNGDMLVHVVERDDCETPMVIQRPHIIMQNALADMGHFQRLSSLPREDFDIEDIMHLHSVLWAGFPHDLNTMASIYSAYNRWKHLDSTNPLIYSGMDAVGTLEIWERLLAEAKRDPQSRYVYHEIQLKLVDVILASAQFRGIKVNQLKAYGYMQHYQHEVQALLAEAQGTVGWPINVGSNEQTARQLYEIERIQDKVFKPRVPRL